MEYLFYLIPGILVYFYYRDKKNSIPKGKEIFYEVIKLIIYTVISYFFIYTFLVIVKAIQENINPLIKPLEYFSITYVLLEQKLVFSIIACILSIILTYFSVKAYNKLHSKKNNYTEGCNIYVDRKKYRDIWFFKYNGKLVTKPTKIYHKNVFIGEGYVVSRYNYPWQNHLDLLIKNSVKFDSKKISNKPVHIYYDFNNEIKIEIYNYVDDKKNKEIENV